MTIRWTFTSNDIGYMLHRDGKPHHGARVLNRPRWGAHRKANRLLFREQAALECARLNRP